MSASITSNNSLGFDDDISITSSVALNSGTIVHVLNISGVILKSVLESGMVATSKTDMWDMPD